MKKALLLIFLSLIIFLISGHSASVELSLTLNATEVEWNKTLNASGNANYLNGTPFNGEIQVKINGKNACKTNASNGFYSCLFNSPLEINEFEVKAYAIENSSTIGESNVVNLKVKYFYGSTKPTKNVAVLELPMLIQNPTGRIGIVKVNLKIWK